MKYFKPDYLQFFKDLAANNNRDWFQANKLRYEASVKKPFEAFIADLITEIKKHDKSINITPSEAIFRINRDVRFSKDKIPYKLNASAVVSRDGRKTDGASGVYVELGPEKFAMAGGIYMPDKEKLLNIRDGIARNPKGLMKVLSDKTFVKVWGELQGEKNKILPAEHKIVADVCPYIFNKQFYFWTELDPEIILTDKLMKTVLTHYLAGKPVGDFLNAQVK
jgi:uncharacterized protein (TIGR02453 family)